VRLEALEGAEVIDLSAVRARKNEPWVSQGECARFFGRTTRTVRRWHGLGCPHRRRYAAVEYRLSEVEAWLAKMGEDRVASS
jgi:phage terminase Nu1 subunit (DNA packaging protein)